MSEPISALAGARYSGMVDLADAGLQGMITLRADLAEPAVAAALEAATGCALPGVRRIAMGPRGKVAWMSPDELLVMVDYDRAAAVVAELEAALDGIFATVANVSDARATIVISGAQARDVLAKAMPVDFSDFAVGELRRSRAAQVAAAVWREEGDRWGLVCFRSVAGYLWGTLATLAQPGGEVGFYR